jgi:hypothetical protein
MSTGSSSATRTKLNLRSVTKGELSVMGWHAFSIWALLVVGFGLMLTSFTALFWAADLIGFPRIAAVTSAGGFEAMVALVGVAATSVRKKHPDGSEGGFYASMWMIFLFQIAVSIMVNVLHASISLDEWFSTAVPGSTALRFKNVITIALCAYAAAVPIGGTLAAHASGFLRKHGAGADWVVDEVPAEASVQAAPAKPEGKHAAGARPAPAPRPVTTAKSAPARPVVTAPVATEAAPIDAQDNRGPLPHQDTAWHAKLEAAAGEGKKIPELSVGMSEEDLYVVWCAAVHAGEEHRFGRDGDLTGTALGHWLNQSGGQGRKVKLRFEQRFGAESTDQRGVSLAGLAEARQ